MTWLSSGSRRRLPPSPVAASLRRRASPPLSRPCRHLPPSLRRSCPKIEFLPWQEERIAASRRWWRWCHRDTAVRAARGLRDVPEAEEANRGGGAEVRRARGARLRGVAASARRGGARARLAVRALLLLGLRTAESARTALSHRVAAGPVRPRPRHARHLPGSQDPLSSDGFSPALQLVYCVHLNLPEQEHLR